MKRLVRATETQSKRGALVTKRFPIQLSTQSSTREPGAKHTKGTRRPGTEGERRKLTTTFATTPSSTETTLAAWPSSTFSLHPPHLNPRPVRSLLPYGVVSLIRMSSLLGAAHRPSFTKGAYSFSGVASSSTEIQMPLSSTVETGSLSLMDD